MKFRLVEEKLTESNNTNLRSFFIGLLSLAGITCDSKQFVIHHTEKNTKINDIDKLVIMYDSHHRSMHAKYRGKEWNNKAHEQYPHIKISSLMKSAVNALEETSRQDETKLEDLWDNY